LEAADVAVMAPGTNTGAAHPVLEGQTLDPVMKEKLENDAAAFLRSYATRRGRNVDAAETAIRESKAFGDQEALNLKLIDFIANDDADLLRQLNGRAITRFDGSKLTLQLAGAQIIEIRPTVRENILDKLMDPNLALVILLLGALLIYLEFHIPGTVVPGAAGALLVLLAAFSLNLLPLHYASVALLICGLLLVVGEAKFPSHGLLSLVGTVAVIFGMLTLINAPVPELRIRLATTLAAGLTFGAITFIVARMAWRARHNKVKTGMQALLGEVAEVQTPLEPEGQVLVRGELWAARCPQGARKGDSVVVRGYHDLTLEVERRA
jgi:membrane-bound serine protease (ClpP class)